MYFIITTYSHDYKACMGACSYVSFHLIVRLHFSDLVVCVQVRRPRSPFFKASSSRSLVRLYMNTCIMYNVSISYIRFKNCASTTCIQKLRKLGKLGLRILLFYLSIALSLKCLPNANKYISNKSEYLLSSSIFYTKRSRIFSNIIV